MTTVELNQVSKHYGPIHAVDRISLRVETGEYATILGPSGSGKTTMLSLIAGIAAPTAGSILIGGRDVTWLPAAQRNVGLVFQSYALFPHMTVFDNVAFPMRVRRTGSAELKRRAAEALALVRLEDFAARKPHQLSGGQQQRVALARAVVFKPDILLLDEPLGALDRKLREEVRGEIHQLQRRLGITTIMVTHDQDEALSLSDRIVVLHGGQVQQIDTPINAYHRPNSRFVADFLGLANFLEGSLERSGGACAIRLASGEAVPCEARQQSAVETLDNHPLDVVEKRPDVTLVEAVGNPAGLRFVHFSDVDIRKICRARASSERLRADRRNAVLKDQDTAEFVSYDA